MSIGSLVNRLLVPPENIASQKNTCEKTKISLVYIEEKEKSNNLKGKYIIL